ncbi:substrate-binding periplasmic protein [Vibrio bivalvicida]|uniref:Amino acid ABC transporter substrate-binding protein n=1 Tax=Vibrio bivalvicida TaxID=1276888 RepID=A0A177Y5B3_9VIBR|nr:transporter substrate-binding domain-containing protein [Vibrio bivalvicida]OAJ96064.1 amino acid ABC transporter substrate-binding protein [Vibrio bivalvicida]
MAKYFWALLSVIISCHAYALKPLNGAQDEWPPYFNSPSQPIGYAHQIVKDTLCLAGYNLQTQFMPWNRAYKSTLEAKTDILLGVWKTPEREQDFLFSHPYYINQIKLISPSSAPIRYQGTHTLSKIRLGLVSGYAYGKALKSKVGLNILAAKDVQENILYLLKHRVDAILMDEIVFSWNLQSMGVDVKDFYVSDLTVKRVPLHIAVSREHPLAEAIISHFNSALRNSSVCENK